MKKKIVIMAIGILLIILLFPLGVTFTKYISQVFGNFLLEAKNFYFNSDKLTIDNATYQINNWSGVGNFTIQFSLNNMKNNILTSSSDINYEISSNCSADITCSLDVTNGTIFTTEKSDNIVLTVIPQRSFDDGESATINVTASSTSPYVKTLKAKFIITVGKRGISYEINDAVKQPYLNFTITNALTSYKVNEAFSTYAVGDLISSDTYLTLNATDKAKCASATITLSFDPNQVVIDSTSEILTNSTIAYTTINGVAYVSSLTFKVEASSSNVIRFYKANVENDYSYPTVNATSIINFSAV